MSKILNIIYFAFCLLGANALADSPNKSGIETLSKTLPTGQMVFDFKVILPADTGINLDGPWSLKLEKTDNLIFTKTEFGIQDLNKDLPGFSLKTTAAPEKGSGSFDYKYIVFFCTKDKTQCFREVHKNSLKWLK